MKIYVTEKPTTAKECLFAGEKHIDTIIPSDGNKPILFYSYICNVNGDLCEMYCGRECDKLVVFNEG